VGIIDGPAEVIRKRAHLEKQYYPAIEVSEDFNEKFSKYLSLKESINLFEQH